MRGTRRLFLALLLALFVLSANGIFFIVETGIAEPRYAPKPFSGENDAGYKAKNMIVSEENSGGQAGPGVGTAPVNLMLLGLDGDETRCDVIMLLNFDPDTSSLNLLSIARDTRVRYGRGYRKINSLYSAGKEKLVADEICEITGLPVHYYITADFRGFRKIIDTLGGVEFYVPFRMKYDDPTQDLHINLKKGKQLLDGRKAEMLVRYRKGNLRGQGYIEGDIGRIRMQQDFIRALIDQKLNFQYISKADDIFAIVRENVKTNIELSDIARYLPSVARIKEDSIKTFVLPGESHLISDVWWYIYDREQTADLIAENFKSY